MIACAADEEYSIGLAVMIRSALENLDPSRRLRIFVVDGGLRPGTRRRMLRSWPAGRFEAAFLTPDWARIRPLPIDQYASHSAYLRLLLPELVPGDVERLLYLDSDLVIRADLGPLWDLDTAGAPVGAVQDIGYPYVDAEIALANFAACKPHLERLDPRYGVRPIENYVELGLDPRAAYLNSGVMLMDLAAWRREDLTGSLLACLAAHREHAHTWDQYALNVVLSGRWQALDLGWNVSTSLTAFPNAAESPFDERVYRAARESPRVVHYVGPFKPWYRGRRGVRHPWRRYYEPYAARVAWPAWRRWRWTLLPPAREWVQKRTRRARKRGRRLGRRLRRGTRGLRFRAAARLRGWLGRRPRAGPGA